MVTKEQIKNAILEYVKAEYEGNYQEFFDDCENYIERIIPFFNSKEMEGVLNFWLCNIDNEGDYWLEERTEVRRGGKWFTIITNNNAYYNFTSINELADDIYRSNQEAQRVKELFGEEGGKE